MDINKEPKDIIAAAKGKLVEKQIEIKELKTERAQAIEKAHQHFEKAVVRIGQSFKRELAEIEKQRMAVEEKKKLLIADEKVHLQRVLDSIEKKY
ncbi:MAG: hypothetical protein LBM72_03080 [Mycoplasmataceae bacterium]|jgi:ABC-type antimicrobial peptide transport system ATPase subunit|nr:hypothetical protein [Mycoplasmataceae bacterium]